MPWGVWVAAGRPRAEAFTHTGAVAGGDAGASVGHAQHGLACQHAGLHGDLTACGHVLQGVVQQVGQGFFQQGRGPGLGGASGSVVASFSGSSPRSMPCWRAKGATGGGDAFGQGIRSGARLQFHRVGAGQGESIWLVWRMASSTWVLMACRAASRWAGSACAQGVASLGGQGGERGAQLVRCVVDEGALLLQHLARACMWVDGVHQGTHRLGAPGRGRWGEVVVVALGHVGAQALQGRRPVCTASTTRTRALAAAGRHAPRFPTRRRVKSWRLCRVSATWMTTRSDSEPCDSSRSRRRA